MEYCSLGNTGMLVSRLCFGALTIGPLQANLPLQEGANVILEALHAGVNFIDTAELYQTYPYIREAIQEFKNKVIIASKSYAYSYEGMAESVAKACRELDREYIDIFSLHEQTSKLTLKGHQRALDYLIEAKEKGIIRAVGVSTHTVEVVKAAALIPEVDVIHPILNIEGIGICDGNAEQMLLAIELAKACGKGIYTMKALGGGHLIRQSMTAFKWVLKQQAVNSIAVGMQSVEEVQMNCTIFECKAPDEELITRLSCKMRSLLIEAWCLGCGKCVEKCPIHALTIQAGKVIHDRKSCTLCGYCGAYCPEFCIKVI